MSLSAPTSVPILLKLSLFNPPLTELLETGPRNPVTSSPPAPIGWIPCEQPPLTFHPRTTGSQAPQCGAGPPQPTMAGTVVTQTAWTSQVAAHTPEESAPRDSLPPAGSWGQGINPSRPELRTETRDVGGSRPQRPSWLSFSCLTCH